MNHKDMAHIVARAHLDAILAAMPENPEPSNICPQCGEIKVYESTQGKDRLMRCQVCNHFKVVEG